MIDLNLVKDYLRIDSDDEDIFIEMLIETSQIYVDKMVGTTYKTDENAVKLSNLLQLKLIADMYENPSNIKQDRIVISILDSLSLVVGDIDDEQ